VFVYQSSPVPVPRRRKRDEAAEEISSILQPNIHLHTHCDMFVTRILVPSIAAPVVCGGKHYLSDLDRQPSPLPAAQNTTPIVYSSNDDCTLHQPDGGYILYTTAMSATQTVGKSKTSRWITVTIIAKRPIPLSPPPPSREGQQ
jgi:hypothetical protein